MPGLHINKSFVDMVNRSLNFWLTKLDCEEREAVHIIYSERHNIIRTCEVALKLPDLWRIAANLICKHRFHIRYSGIFIEWFGVIETSIFLSNEEKNNQLMSILYLVKSDLQRELYNIKGAISSSEKALELSYITEDHQLIAQSIYYLGQNLRLNHEFDEAISLGKKSLKYCQKFGFEFWEGHALNLLGGAHMERGDFSAAEKYLIKSKNLKVMKNSNMGYAVLLINLSQCYMYQKKFAESLTHLYDAIEIIKKLEYKRYLSAAYSELGLLYYRMGDYSQAEQAYNNVVIEHFRESGDWFREALILHNLGTVKMKQKKLLKAQKYFDDCIEIWREHEQSIRLASSLSYLGKLYLMVNKEEKARNTFKEVEFLVPPNNESVLAKEIRERINKYI